MTDVGQFRYVCSRCAQEEKVDPDAVLKWDFRQESIDLAPSAQIDLFTRVERAERQAAQARSAAFIEAAEHLEGHARGYAHNRNDMTRQWLASELREKAAQLRRMAEGAP